MKEIIDMMQRAKDFFAKTTLEKHPMFLDFLEILDEKLTVGASHMKYEDLFTLKDIVVNFRKMDLESASNHVLFFTLVKDIDWIAKRLN